MLTFGRRMVTLLALSLLAVAGYGLWTAYSVHDHLRGAQASYAELTTALSKDDYGTAREAADVLASQAADAREGAHGPMWWVVAQLPLLGDDATGLRALTASLDVIARDAFPPLLEVARDAEDVQGRRGLDLQVISALGPPLVSARDAMAEARTLVTALDSSGYARILKSSLEGYADSVSSTVDGLDSAVTAVDVLPGMLGEERRRRYLLVFQNNAEIRATGGMPGNFVEVVATDGRLRIVSGRDPRVYAERTPPLPITPAERAVYDNQLGSYFQDANFTPHFPRAADLMRARWEEHNPRRLDGILAIDPVALTYLLAGTGPVQVDGLTLTADNAVPELLRDPYVERSTDEQDAFFSEVAEAIFAAATTDVDDPIAFARALGHSATEGRFLVRSFDDAEQDKLSGTRAAGELSGDDGDTPHVDIGLNDGTGSKMSYYLRYWADVRARDCMNETQRLTGTMTLTQSISPRKAAELPDSLTGGGFHGTTPGGQLVFVRIYGPFGGTVSRIRIDGELIPLTRSVDLDGRPVSTLAVAITSTRGVVVTWDMTTASGQTGDGELGLTPSVVRGSNDSAFASAC